MLRFSLLIMTALAAHAPVTLLAQASRKTAAACVLALPGTHDSIRLWHRHLNDSTLAILIPNESNFWLSSGYEFTIPLGGRYSGPVTLTAALPHPDSLTLSCTTQDFLCSGYRLFFSRGADGFGIYAAADFQIFRSGIERICDVPLRIRVGQDRTKVSPTKGMSPCRYIYQRQLLVSFPETGYRLP